MIVVNLDKAKNIAHNLRRTARDAAMAPFDAVIAKNIPGVDNASIETKRQSIRIRFADIQNRIDAAETVDELFAEISSANIV